LRTLYRPTDISQRKLYAPYRRAYLVNVVAFNFVRMSLTWLQAKI